MATFWDTLLPSLAQSAAQGGAGALSGKVQGLDLAEQIRQRKALEALRAMQVQQSGEYHQALVGLGEHKAGLAERQLGEKQREFDDRMKSVHEALMAKGLRYVPGVGLVDVRQFLQEPMAPTTRRGPTPTGPVKPSVLVPSKPKPQTPLQIELEKARLEHAKQLGKPKPPKESRLSMVPNPLTGKMESRPTYQGVDLKTYQDAYERAMGILNQKDPTGQPVFATKEAAMEAARQMKHPVKQRAFSDAVTFFFGGP